MKIGDWESLELREDEVGKMFARTIKKVMYILLVKQMRKPHPPS
jgi:hypothetical protein